jgi:DNA replication and repair protein RecF
MISDIRLQHFRSYNDAFFELDPSVNIIVGANASGKTNLLEAVLVSCIGASYRTKDAELIQFGQDWARLDAGLPAGVRVIKIQNRGAAALKTFEIDGQKLTRLHLSKQLPVVLFEPNHLLLLSGSPDLRRSFLDDLIEQTEAGYGTTRRQYRRVLSQRNSLLKANPAGLEQQLFVWNLRLSELGGQIAQRRHALIERFNGTLSELYSSLAGALYDVCLTYTTRFNAATYETELLRKLEANPQLEALRGFTAYGPHRDDLGVEINGHPAQEAASRGENRTLVLALKIMEMELVEDARGARPILLLDDVFSELDARRRQALTQYVGEYQTFVTTTDADVVMHHFPGSNLISTALK